MFFDKAIRNVQPVIACAADRYESGPTTSEIVDCRKADGVTFILHEGAGGTGTATVTIEKCDSAGANNVAIAFKVRANSTTARGDLADVAATGYATIAGADKVCVFYVDAKDLGALGYCKIILTELVDAACVAGVTAIVHESSAH